MSSTLVTILLAHIECHKCHGVYGLTREANQRYLNQGGGWWCPYCGTETVAVSERTQLVMVDGLATPPQEDTP